MKKMLMGFAWLVFAVPSLAWANSAPVTMRGIGGADVIPIKNDQIQMVRETVNIECTWTTYTVNVDFTFRNTTDRNQELQIGFPIEYFTYFEDVESIQDGVRSMVVEWNNEPLEFEAGRLINDKIRNGDLYRQWIYWSAHFKPHEEATNRVTYTFPMWLRTPGDKIGDNNPNAYLKYTLRTGSAWAGPIESSIVRIRYDSPIPHFLALTQEDLESPPKESHLKMYPEGSKVDGDRHLVIWEFTDVEPQEDIFFGWGSVPDFSELDKEQMTVIHDGEVEFMEPQLSSSGD